MFGWKESCENMIEGYIDSASTYEIVSILRYEQPEESYEWAWRSAIEVTCSLINIPHLKMAPSPSVYGGASGPYGQLTHELSEFITHCRPNPRVEEKAMMKTKIWSGRYPEKVLAAYDKIKADRNNFPIWLEGAITHAWTEHSARLGGLFNFEFIQQISRILNVDESYLKDIWKQSCNREILDEYAKHRFDRDGLKIMEDAYVVSALIRGRYHDYVAELSSMQILHHPIREPVLNKLNGIPNSEFGVSNVERYLSTIIMAGAYAEKSQQDRISCWGENVRRARIAAQKQKIDLQQKDSDDIAIDLAVKSAKELNIRVHPKKIEMTLDVIAAMGVNILTSFVLTPWLSFTVGGISYAVSRKTDIGQKGAHLFYGTQKRLHDLAVSRPGRIQPIWK